MASSVAVLLFVSSRGYVPLIQDVPLFIIWSGISGLLEGAFIAGLISRRAGGSVGL
jgi:hypothetical protein